MTDDPSKPPSGGVSRDLVPARRPAAKSGFLARVRAAKAPALRGGDNDRAALIAAALEPAAGRPRLVFGIDATASREPAWAAALATTDSLFEALPGELDVALAVHGGSEVHTFTRFSADPAALREQAAGIRCRAGQTRLGELMRRSRAAGGVRVLLYAGDVVEEDPTELAREAGLLKLLRCRLVVLHDRSQAPPHDRSGEVFAHLATMTGGAVLPFEAGSRERLREILAAVGALAIGGPRLLREKRAALPGARLLLAQMGEDERP